MTKRVLRLLAALLLLAAFCPGVRAQDGPQSWRGRVLVVIDGDSLVVRRQGKRVKVRLAQVDCPEPQQPFGRQAKRFTIRAALGKTVLVENAVVDPYYKKRMRASVILPDGRDLGLELVKEGLAWNYRRYSTNPLLPDLEKDARRQKLGLWSQPHPTPPWQWRKLRKQKGNP